MAKRYAERTEKTGEDVIGDTSRGLHADDGIHVDREKVSVKEIHLPDAIGIQQVRDAP